MKKLMIIIAFLLLTTALAVPVSYAATYTCTSDSTCQSAVNSASVGDTVTLTQSASFGSTVTIGKGITFKGFSQSVTITGSVLPHIQINRNTSSSTVITNLTFSGGDSIYIGGTAGASGGVGPIIHDCIFIQPSSGSAMVRFQNNGGVLYSNTFTAQSGWVAAYFLVFKDSTNLAQWQTNSTMGTADTTGMNNTYIEGNTFNYSGAAAFDLDDASRTVIRYNTFENSAIAGHGLCTSAVGVRHYEILNNAFNYTFYSTDQGNVANGWIRPRGGTGVVTGNTFADITGWGSKADFTIADWMIGSACNCSGQYGGCCTSYPCVRQTSVSWNNGGYIIDPLYLGGNTHTGQGNGIILGLDGCSPYCGSLAITDIDQQGRNYNYTTKPGYTPYTCPHPLAGSGTCSGVGAAGYSLTGGSPPPPSPTSPSPPQNLQIQP